MPLNAIIEQIEIEALRRVEEDGEPDNLNWFRREVIWNFIDGHTQEQVNDFLYRYFPEATDEYTEDMRALGINLKDTAYNDLLHLFIYEIIKDEDIDEF